MMKKIFNIAKNELYSLFYSPIAWVLMILFLVMTSADYIASTDNYLGMFQRGGPYLKSIENMSMKITTHMGYGYFFGVIGNLYIFLPLITMGLISRERSSGTMKLLYSSPVRTREIVMGKYLAILTFTFCLMVLLSLTLVGLSLSIVHPDYGQLFVSVLGLFLVLGTYAAIGLFVSSLTNYQIVAAIITLGIFALLSDVGNLWQDIPTIKDITYYINIRKKSYNFINGLLNTRDFFYFMIFIGSFLLFTVFRIKAATESISRARKAMRYVTVIVIAFVVGYITSRPALNLYWDTTRAQVFTITPPTQATLARLNDGELKVTVFGNLFDKFGMFQMNQQNELVSSQFEQYIRFKPDMKINFVYYYDEDTSDYHFKNNPGKTIKQIAEKDALSRRVNFDKFLSPEEVKKLVDTKAEEYRCFFLLEYKGKKTILRTFDDQLFWPREDEFAAALNRLINTPPKISFMCDDIERGPYSKRPRDYRLVTSKLSNRYALINQGYDFDTLSLKKVDAVPDDIAALVIPDPRLPISPENLDKIYRYIDRGGNLFISSEPDRKEVTKPIFDKLGISLRDGMLIQPSDRYASDVVFTYITDSAKNLSPQFARDVTNEVKYFGDPLLKVAMAGASVMDYREKDGFHIYPLLTTDGTLSWNRLAPISNDSLQTKVGKMPNDEHGGFVTALRMNRNINGRDQRIIVASDADYLSSPQLGGEKPTRYNFNFGFWCFSYFSYGKFPANTLRPESLDNAFKIKASNIPFQKTIYYWVIPILIGVFASIILIRRKRK